jgi:hypothetical protein
MAGRYWYLEEDSSPDMVVARKTFEKAFGNNSILLLQALKFRGDIEAIGNSFAKQTLISLQRRAKDEHGYIYQFGVSSLNGNRSSHVSTFKEKLFGMGCLIIVAIALGLMLLGLDTIMRHLLGTR